jgi:hypothetical protein
LRFRKETGVIQATGEFNVHVDWTNDGAALVVIHQRAWFELGPTQQDFMERVSFNVTPTNTARHYSAKMIDWRLGTKKVIP